MRRETVHTFVFDLNCDIVFILNCKQATPSSYYAFAINYIICFTWRVLFQKVIIRIRFLFVDFNSVGIGVFFLPDFLPFNIHAAHMCAKC